MNTMTKDGVRNLRLESIYHAMETSFGLVRAKIISGLQASDGDINALVNFVAAQMVRTPKFRGYWRIADRSEREPQVLAIDHLATRTKLENIIHNLDANHKQVISLIAFPKAVELLTNMRAQLFRAPNPRAFITSDSPCCVIDYKDAARSPFDSLAGPTVNVLMPLSPDVIILFDKSEEPHKMTQIYDGHPFVDQVNAMIWAGSVSQVVLPGSDIREDWFDKVTLRRQAGYSVM